VKEPGILTEPFHPISRLLHFRSKGLAKGAPLALPIALSSTFQQPGEPDGTHHYGRSGNPTVEEVEAELGLLENASCLLFSSGMAAIAAVLYTHLRPGDRVVCHADGYYQVRALLETHFAPLGIRIDYVPTTYIAQTDFSSARLVLLETPSNPGLDVCDVREVRRNAPAGTIIVADNTLATPMAQRPLDLGADIAVMANTKSMGGHSDILAGQISTRSPDMASAIQKWRKSAGPIISPMDAYLLHRGIQTLELRTQRANANALSLARLLSGQRGISGVRYPGLAADPGHTIASRQMTGFGPVLCFSFETRELAEAFIDRHPLLASATSFGGVHSSAECRVRWGDNVVPGFVRFACGIEPEDDLIRATRETLQALSP
jgi:cystathionine gamma-lyase